MSSIRRSSLISITLGLLTFIGGYVSFASLEEAAGQCLECLPLSVSQRLKRIFGKGWRGQARIIGEVEAKDLPASAATSGGASVSTARAGCPLSASEAVTAVTGYSSSTPLFFGRRVIDVQSPNHRPSTTVGAPNGHSTHLPASTMYVSVMIGA
jgi:hypothetical protein